MDLPPDIRAKVDAIRARPGRVSQQGRKVFFDNRVSPAEARVVELVAEGLTNIEVAERLGIAEETVKSHMRHAIGRTASRNRTHLAVRFVRGEFRVGLS